MGLLTPRRPRIDRLRRRGDVAGLCDALAYRDVVPMTNGEAVDLGAPLRRDALAALNELDDERALAAAAEALEDDDDEVRIAAARLLRSQRVAEPVVACLARSSSTLPEHVRDELREALLEMDAPGLGIAFAGRLIRDGTDAPLEDGERIFLNRLLASAPEPDRRELARVAVEEFARDDQPRRERAFLVLSSLGEAGVDALRDLLDQPRRAEAAEAIGRLRDSSALPALVELLGDPEAAARAAAARALGEIRDPRAVEGLLGASTDSEYVVRQAASEALDQLGTSAIVFAVAAFVRPLLAGGAAQRIEPMRPAAELIGAAQDAPAPDVPHVDTVHMPEGAEQGFRGPPPGALARLRRAARRARAGRRDG